MKENIEDLQECYENLLPIANDKKLTRFIFLYNNNYYIVIWVNGRWSDPQSISLI